MATSQTKGFGCEGNFSRSRMVCVRSLTGGGQSIRFQLYGIFARLRDRVNSAGVARWDTTVSGRHS